MTARPKTLQTLRVLVPLLVLVLAAGLAACNRPSGDEPGSCAPEDLIAPDPTYPVGGSVIDDLSPVFEWTYPDYTCLPSEFRVLLSSSDSWFDSGPILARATVSGTTMRWDPGVSVNPGDIYTFSVGPIADGEDGPWVAIHFFTGPRCTGDESRQPPELAAPADGARLTAMRAHFRWDDPTPCVTNRFHYWLEVGRSPRFSGAHEQWASIFEDQALPNRLDEYSFEPCTTYYWRVRSGTPPDGLDGVYSETWSFTTPAESGTACPITLVITPMIPAPGVGFPFTGHAAIGGHVFHDECATPWETTTVAPPGCVILPDATIEANGTLDPGESGIEGVTVLLDDGPCPGTDGWSTTTDAEGQYGFYDLAAGRYCLEVPAETDGNDLILIPGNWTVPYRWYGPGPISLEVALGSDDDISRLNDFGWDYQFLPSPGGSPSGTPFARVLTDARCRLGPGFEYPILTYLSQGVSFPIVGRLEQGGWWLLRAGDLARPCWIGEDVVEPIGDLSDVPFALPPALPTEEPTKEPPSGCWCWQVGPQFPNGHCVPVDPCPGHCTKCP